MIARRTYLQEWHRKNPGKHKTYGAKYRSNNPTKYKRQAAERTKRYRKRHPDRITAYRKANADSWAFREVRRRAKRLGILFTIIKDDYVMPVYCPVLGIKLERGVKVSHDASPTLDRIDPAKGYVKGNVAVISRKANVLKGGATAAQHRIIADWIDSQLTKLP